MPTMLSEINAIDDERKEHDKNVLFAIYNIVNLGSNVTRDQLRKALGSDIYREAEIAASLDAKSDALFQEGINA